MKRLVIILILTLTVNTIFAQKDPRAKEVLDKLSVTTKSYKTIQIDFSFTLENKKNNINQTNEGSITLKGISYRLHMPAFGMDIFCDGKTAWSYLADAKEANISGVEENSDDALNPANIFTIYEKGYLFNYIEEENLNGKTVQVIDLFPEDNTKEMTKIRLYVDKAKSQIAKAQTFNKDGNTYILVLKSMKTDQPFGDDYFRFDKAKYPGVTVNDMR